MRDTDQSTASPHHTLGTRATQAAPGNHTHGGGGGGGGGGSATVDTRAQVVQDIFGTNSSSTSKAVTLASVPSSSNLLILTSGIAGVNAITSVTQTNVTWTLAARTVGFSPTAEVWKGIPTGTPGTTVTVAYNGSAAFNSIYVAEVAGRTGTVGVSAVSFAQEPFSKGYSPSITPTAGSLVIIAAAKGSGSPDYSEGLTWANPSGIQIGALSAIALNPLGTVGTCGVGLLISGGTAVQGVFGGATSTLSTKAFAVVEFT